MGNNSETKYTKYKNRFRVWDSDDKKFLHFNLWNINFPISLLHRDAHPPQQFIGVFDSRLKEIYEGDVVKFDKYEGTAVGEVKYYSDGAMYALDSDIGVVPLGNISLESLQVLGNTEEDFRWNPGGTALIKKHDNTYC